MTSPIELLAMQSQEQHRRYHELFGTQPGGRRRTARTRRLSRELGQQERDIRQGVIKLDFSTAVTG